MIKRLTTGFTALLMMLSLVTPASLPSPVSGPGTLPSLPLTDILKAVTIARQTPATLVTANSFDYYADSVTGLTDESYTTDEINRLLKDYGVFEGPAGMPVEEYKEAMEQEWTDATVYNKKVQKIAINITKSYTYSKIVSFLKILSHRDGVYLFDIGSTTAGRRMYALEVDIPSDKDKQTVVLTGSIHARETAGTTFLLKEITDLLQADTDESREVLENIRFAIVVCVNPDGREGVAFDTANYTYRGGTLWKATSNGTDLNRNFPGLSWSMIRNGYKKAKSISTSSDKIFYPGDYGGSCNETKAMMKFLYHYIVLEHATAIIDYHQQGRIAYAGKAWLTDDHHNRCIELANTMFKTMNPGNSRKYYVEEDNKESGQDGEGSTLTDFALSVALGAKFSPGYGCFVFTDGKKEYPLIAINRLETTDKKVLENANFITQISFEIGLGTKMLGYSKETRKLLSGEYVDYHFDRVLYTLNDFLKSHTY
ncbi:MAG: hypothetical protein J6Y89_07465 [Lachnospiraceae bacterium]|nr:hypothetical protein [Lachnospiraceae bacterium]